MGELGNCGELGWDRHVGKGWESGRQGAQRERERGEQVFFLCNPRGTKKLRSKSLRANIPKDVVVPPEMTKWILGMITITITKKKPKNFFFLFLFFCFLERRSF